MKTLIIAIAVFFCFSASAVHADDATKKAVAEDLLRTMKVDQMMKPILKRYTDRLIDLMQQTLNWDTLGKDVVAIYTRVFTEDELKGMLAFYESTIGQAVLAKFPSTMQESMSLMQRRMPELQQKMNQISQELAEEIKAKKKEQERKREEKPGQTAGA